MIRDRQIVLSWNRDSDPSFLRGREWLVTNGLGGYASGTLAGIPALIQASAAACTCADVGSSARTGRAQLAGALSRDVAGRTRPRDAATWQPQSGHHEPAAGLRPADRRTP